jgi:hypothetical protein
MIIKINEVLLMKLRKKGFILSIESIAIIVIVLLVLFIGVFILNKYTNLFSSGIDPLSADSAIKLCITNNMGAIDTDGDGIPDVCDPCVLITDRVSEAELCEKVRAPDNVKWSVSDIHSYNPGFRTNQQLSVEDMEKYDNDGDGIVGICDSDPKTKARMSRGSSDLFESECKKVKEKLEVLGLDHRLSVIIRPATTGRYNTCVITYLSN